MGHPPTPEQQAAIDIAKTGESCVIEALAGTGKTSTLQFISEAMPAKNVTYIAFNKAIVSEVEGRFPSNVTARTAHSLAYGAVGKNYRNRLNGGRVTSAEVAQRR
jgi:superfamily I DNA/RNA helicase